MDSMDILQREIASAIAIAPLELLIDLLSVYIPPTESPYRTIVIINSVTALTKMEWNDGNHPSPVDEKVPKRVRTQSSHDATYLPPPPDCPPYLHAEHLPSWVGRQPAEELTSDKADELHHIQWYAWKEQRDYHRVLEVAPLIFNSSFTKLNPHNFSITVGLTAEALYRCGASPLACANTLLYGLSLLANNPSKASLPIQFCREGAMTFMEAWAQESFGESLEPLFEFCEAYPHTGLPDVLGRRLQKRVEALMTEGRNRQAMELLKRILTAPWTQEHKVWDEDVYWRLRLLSYTCKRRTQEQEGKLPSIEPVIMKMLVIVFTHSSGKLPQSFQEGSEDVECGLSFSKEQLSASLAAMREAFDLFSESFLALTGGLVRWELEFKPQYILEGACMPARPYHRETESPTNPARFVSQADVEASEEFKNLVNRQDDETIRTAQAVLVLWPGLQPAGTYMVTCGGITPSGYGGRMVYMSDGMMLEGRPVWWPEWFHHETFHIMEHIFPESTFGAMSEICAHPCFLRDQWPAEYQGHYEWDFSFFSYKWILSSETKPTLAERLARIPGASCTQTLDVQRPETGALIARLFQQGDTVILKGIGAISFKPGNFPKGLMIQASTQKEEGAKNDDSAITGLAVWWIPSSPCYVVTVAARNGGREAHNALVRSFGEGARALLEQWPCHQVETDSLANVSLDEVKRLTTAGQCTVLATGRSWVEQVWYFCRTCKEEGKALDGLGSCESCARKCHSGHVLERREPSMFFCDCGLDQYPLVYCECGGPGDADQRILEEDEEGEQNGQGYHMQYLQDQHHHHHHNHMNGRW